LLLTNFSGKVNDVAYRKAPCFVALSQYGMKSVPGMGAPPFKIPIVKGKNSSFETFTETQAPGTAVAHTFIQGSLDVVNFRQTISHSRFALEAAMKGGYVENGVDLSMQLSQLDFQSQMDDELVGTRTDFGLAAIVDSALPYMGIDPATHTEWQSYEVNSAGAYSSSMLDTMYSNLTGRGSASIPRGANPNVILTTVDIAGKHSRLAGIPGTANNSVLVPGNNNGGYEAAFSWATGSYQGVPIVPVATLTSGELYMLDLSGWEFLVYRDLTADAITLASPEMFSAQLSTRVAVKVPNRNKQGKITGIT
jgi:hypothetical protein